jgi:hypothetical protein
MNPYGCEMVAPNSMTKVAFSAIEAGTSFRACEHKGFQ